jgi:hypothetical protein
MQVGVKLPRCLCLCPCPVPSASGFCLRLRLCPTRVRLHSLGQGCVLPCRRGRWAKPIRARSEWSPRPIRAQSSSSTPWHGVHLSD